MIDPHNHPYRNMRAWNCNQIVHESLDAFLGTHVGNALHTIMLDGVPLDIQLSMVTRAPAAIVLNGYFPREAGLLLPIFAGFGIIPGGSGISRISISDPSMHLSNDIGIGWYAGLLEIKLQQILPRIIAHILKCCKASRVCFLGGSAGGFASLYYATFFPGAIAFVWNPQTDIRRYNPDHVTRYAHLAFGSEKEIGAARKVLTRRIDPEVISRYPTDGVKVIYLQNKTDWHVESHLSPFLTYHDIKLTRLPNWLHVHLGEWGEGHVPPPKEIISRIVREICFTNGGYHLCGL